MEDIKKLYNLYRLKEVERYGVIKERAESSAEHVYSSLILAQYFFPKIKKKLDELKVMKMLLFHDLVEIESGDVFVLDEENAKTQKEKEKKAFEVLKTKIPKELAEEYHKLWVEYEEGKTIEAKFCQAIDKLDPIIDALEQKYLWKKFKFTEKKLRDKKQMYMEAFPAILETFEKLLKYANENDYFYNEKK